MRRRAIDLDTTARASRSQAERELFAKPVVPPERGARCRLNPVRSIETLVKPMRAIAGSPGTIVDAVEMTYGSADPHVNGGVTHETSTVIYATTTDRN